jgi:hypothetical protein
MTKLNTSVIKHFKFSVSTFANNMTSQNQACLAAFGTCRKYQDDASAAISACDQSPIGLASKLKSLATNQNSVDEAQATMSSLRARKGALNFRQQQQTQIQCADVVDFAAEMTYALKENPASQKIAKVAKRIANASGVICSQDEISSLEAADAEINATETLIVEELASVQESLLGKYN